MPPGVPEGSTAASPLAPSVEKAYYRKCIELKRRLNEVEASNDEAKVRRIRLDRAIMKMRLERAFLLDQLSKRMDVDVDGSEGSGDEQVNTPPPDRPHRDKKRKLPGDAAGAAIPSSAARPSDVAMRDSPSGSPSQQRDGADSKSGINRGAGAVGQAVGTGPTITEDANGQRRVTSGEAAPA